MFDVGWDKAGFQSHLLSWFEREGRDFPWRNTRDPFAMLVAEKLLQQTKARDGVVSAYSTILATYPTPVELSQARLSELEAIVQPLGLGYRAAELKDMAKALVDHYGGSAPGKLDELMKLPGVGSYSARAVLSFAYGQDVPVVDTNVARILYRVFSIPGKFPANPARKRSLLDLASFLLPPWRSRDFNFALLDLGALICKARSPDCPNCPVLEHCQYGLGVVE